MAEPEAAQEAKVGADTRQPDGKPREPPNDTQTGSGSDVSILFVGDLVGSIGRHTLLECLPILRERYAPTFVVVNAENVAGGLGITPKVAEELFRNEIDAITLGNHAYHRREIYSYLDTKERIVRPFNYLRGTARARRVRGRERGSPTRRGQPQRQPVPEGRPLCLHRDRPGVARAGQGRPCPGGHARRGDQREGGSRLALGRDE